MVRLVVLLTLGVLLLGCEPRPEALVQAGVADLRLWNPAGSPVALNGEWVFAPQDLTSPGTTLAQKPPQFRGVPDVWSTNEAGEGNGFGAATYHLTILLPPSVPPLAIRLSSVSTAFLVEANGQPVAQGGRPALKADQDLPAYKPGPTRLPEVQGKLDLTIRVSNHTYRVGGLWYPVQFGTVKAIEPSWLADLAFALGHSVALAAIGVMLLVLFLLRRHDRSFIFSALLSMTLAIRGLVTGDYLLVQLWPDVPFEVLVRLEYLTVYLCFPVASGLFRALVPEALSPTLVRVLRWTSWVFVAQVILLPLSLLTRSIFAFYAYALVAVAIYLYALISDALRRKDRNAKLLLGGGLVLSLSIVNDALYSSFFLKTTNLGTWGFLFFILVLVWIIFERFTLAFSKVENLVSEKDLLILEIQHRVRNNLQLMAGLVSLQAKRMDQPEAKEALTSLRARILSMGLVHEKLYGRAKDTSLDLGDYLMELVGLLAPLDAMTTQPEVKVDLKPRERPVDLCLNLGLIVAELVNNAWKHVLLPRRGSRLTLMITGDKKQVSLVMEDDGPGFPANFQPDRRRSLGYQLISSLTDRYNGTWEILPGPGGRVRVVLKV